MDTMFNSTEIEIIEAYLSLLEEKRTGDSIKVIEVIQKAYIGRATFYRYFCSIEDIAYRIEAHCFDELHENDKKFELVTANEESEDLNLGIFEQYSYDVLIILKKYNTYFLANYHKLGGTFAARLEEWYLDSFKKRLVDRYGYLVSSIVIPFVGDYVSGGIIHNVINWMLNQCHKPVETMVDEIQFSTYNLVKMYFKGQK